MKIVFRLNYHTVPGQSLWLKLTTIVGTPGLRFDQVLPMSWINARQWQAELDLKASGAFGLEYSYQLRQEPYGVELDEWNGPRLATADPEIQDALVLLDTWCSAGTVDFALETKAFAPDPPSDASFRAATSAANANHTFQLRMAAVPKGLVPCLIGSVREIGDWGWHHAVPLTAVVHNFR